MSNYPQDNFIAPDISGKWRYWSNFQSITSDGISEIQTLEGVIDITQDNLFFNYINTELNFNHIGVFVQNNRNINGKNNTQWIGKIINNANNSTLTFYPYSYQNCVPKKMTGTNILPGPLETNNPATVYTIYYERI
jgi:hypothetical protein